jgi:Bacteriophage Lambda NinG protein
MMNSTAQPPITQNLHNIPAGWNTADTESQSLSRTSAGCTSDCGPKSEKGLKQPKPKRCKSCKNLFNPQRPMQSVCGPDCAIAIAGVKKRATEAKEAREAAIADKVKRERLKTKGEYIKEAQAAFNAWVRARDAGLPCICCGRPMGENVPGGAVDAGHFRSRGSAPHLRFDERNVHAQRKQCNRYESGNYAGMKIGMIERIGLGGVEALEADQTPRRYTIDDLKTIRDTYREKAKALKDNR